jgi:hypothetical protein
MSVHRFGTVHRKQTCIFRAMSGHPSRGGRQAAYRRSHERWRDTSDDTFAHAVRSSHFAADVLRSLGFDLSGGNYLAVRRRVARLNLDITHWHRGRPPAGRPLDSVLVPGGCTNRHRLKLRLLRAGRLHNVCGVCGLGPRWNDQPLMLVLDHINGINDDYRPTTATDATD